MVFKQFKYTFTVVLTLVCLLAAGRFSFAQEAAGEAGVQEEKTEKGFDANEVILQHIKDAHEWHFFTWKGHPVSLSLPVILYVPNQGWSVFSSARFHHGEEVYKGFQLMTGEYIHAHGLDPNKFFAGKVIAVNEDGSPNMDKAVYDLSLTRNVMQMILAALLLFFIFRGMAGKYEKNPGKAPSGFQNAVEPFVIFIRDSVARPYLGKKTGKYLPYLLTVFFFIWINALVSLIPGSANVAGNLAFTGVLAAVTFVFILTSTNKHYWQHIIWPPGVPLWVKPILIPVEILGIFTKPFALMIRLFANMLAGHMIILSIISLIFIFGGLAAVAGWSFSFVSIAFTIFMYLVELLVGFIQAFIFTNLSALFIAQAFEGGHHDEEEVIL
ncbi:F0F1 ATP synthase subunit A [Compostibacter hankyongensis]